MSVVDTNVLVYFSAEASPSHLRARIALEKMRATEPIAVTRQILREFLAATTRPQSWGNALAMADALRSTDEFGRRFAILEDGPLVWSHLKVLASRFAFGGKQVHDTNIVATMLAHGERRLLTFNIADFRRFADVIEVVAP